MKKLLFKAVMLLLLICLGVASAQAQGRLIRKIQERAEDKAVEEIFKDKKGEEQPPAGRQDRDYGGYDESSPSRQQRGGGLEQTKYDVLQSIANAESAHKAAKYKESKDAVRQALWGVELEIGRNLLKSLPESVEGLQMVPEEDRVTSSGIGFVGLVIERVYRDKKDIELRTSIGNDAALLGLAGMFMAGGMYVQSSEETNQKQIRFQDHRATISYDDYDGYTLGVPFGQSSVFVLKGSNFETETQFMAAANNFDIEKIKKELGEQ